MPRILKSHGVALFLIAVLYACAALMYTVMFPDPVIAQPQPPGPIRYVTADPTGQACTAKSIALRTPAGTLFTCKNGVYAASGSTGTVTSIATTAPITGGTITGTGTIALNVAVDHAFTAPQSVTQNNIGAVSTDGLVCTNTTAATAVTQQWSCRIRLTGAGWKTNATAASQTADWFVENQTVLGAAVPSTLLAMTPQIAGTPTGTAVYITAPNTGVYHDGAILLGGTTASFSGFRSQGNTIGAILADASAFANFQAGSISASTTLTATTSATAATYLTAANCLSVAAPAVCAAASAGASTIAGAATTKVVNTTAVTANSNISITRDDSLGTRLGVTCNTQSDLVLGTPRVTARTAATSFTVLVDVAPTTNPVCFNYTITN